MNKIWHTLFLEERPSVSLSLFRIAVAITVGAHVIPTLWNLPDNYYATALKTFNFDFFPVQLIELVQRSSDQTVLFFVIVFYVFWFFFLIGLFSRLSCILMTLAGYYFYALNSLHVETLSWDILLVTLFLMCLTPYHGDYFSMDALRKGDAGAYRRPRPFFIQRLLQMQIASTFFYTALYKTTAQGNWFRDNPLHYLVNYPPSGVTKNFLIKDWMAVHPDFCYVTGILIIIAEFAMPFLLFIPRTRRSAIVLGCFFHVLLILTLDVPALFFFLFPAQLFLFVNPVRIIEWVEAKRRANGVSPKIKVVYDGDCGFCMHSVNALRVMDLFGKLDHVNFRTADLAALHPSLTYEKAESQLYIIEPDGHLYGGFFAFRRLCWVLPMMFPLILLLD